MAGIRSQMLLGVKWTSLSTITITFIQIVQFGLLAHRLSVAQFGLVGLLTTLTLFSQILLDMGIGSAVIQKEDVAPHILSTLFWLNIIMGFFLFVFLTVASPLIADFFHREELVHLLRVLSFMFLIAPIGQQSQYLLQKELRFQELAIIEMASTILAFIVLIVFMFIGDPVYAFVLSQVILYGIKSLLYFLCYINTWRPSFVFNLSGCKDVLKFGVYQLLSRVVNRIGSNMDVILIGRFMGAEALGVYNLVYQVITIPVLRINPIMTRVAFPVFSKNQHDNTALNDGFLHMTELLSLVTFPILLGLTVVSKSFIITFFGDKWVGATEIMSIMSIVGILRVLMNPNGSVILAKGKATIAFYWDAGVLLIYGIGLYFAVKTDDLQIVAWTYAVVSLVNFFIGRWLLAWLIELRWKAYIRTIARPLGPSLLITAAAYLLTLSCTSLRLEAVWSLVLPVMVAAILYVFLLRRAYPSFFQRFKKGALKS
ncbi:MOP flippase family protein [Pullulanibacillus sp. KACC 23026]|uniref:teichuronic acid biosynthesis protein TuaB n=1 Tax=Pullulanibacillus sp. KACC 23026 TaxID=3028315 RepID=UPI0023B08B0B|nr:MOP flippase family protein [Pullulanibacillus sp. KACC 23026]WEG12633.1 MOP flippase family protein [Pullulanibacillus sp. KACC 23026]